MAKYVAIIDTDEYKDFKVFEDGCGEYLVARDENAQSDEWICLPLIKAETNGDVIKAIFDVTEEHFYDEDRMVDVYGLDRTDDPSTFYADWWNEPYQKGGKE